ncbi:MAG TPA: M20/M25/M40 family metallo-hydrolase [Vicinamibacteria bacterium]|nr:M20/M25/M40 family metallo-hydrolase [Vicinamibacteria bacterium]
MNLRSLLPLGVLAALAVPVPASPADEAVDLEMVSRIRDEGFTNSKVMDTAAYLTDVIGPRVTGSPQMRQANDWTRQQLESWGLASAHIEGWTFGRGWTLEQATVQMLTPTPASLVAVPRAFTPGTDGPRRGKVVRVKVESEADAEKYRGQLAGRIVLLSEPRATANPDKPQFRRYNEQELTDLEQFDSGPTRTPVDREVILKRTRLQRMLRTFLTAEKALASIEQSPVDGGIVVVGRGGSYVKGEDPGVPALVMAAEQYNRLVRLVERNVDVQLELDIRAHFQDDDPTAYNTVAEIPGTDKQHGEIVMVGAHLDSWHAGTGATDNAAGCAVALEAMRILQALEVKPRRTIRIALWSGEEEGLLGSRAYVAEHFGSRADAGNPQDRDLPSFMRTERGPVVTKPEYARLSAYFNLDNGSGKIRGIYAERNAAAAPIFDAWLQPLHDLGATTVTLRHTGSTDHVSFDGVGLPAFQFIQDEGDYETRTHHSNLDVYDRLQKADLIQASIVLASFAYDAATRPDRMPRRPSTREVPAVPAPAPAPAH